MNPRLRHAARRLLPLAFLAPLTAAEPVALSPGDLERLGIQFARLAPPETGTGPAVAATIISSPEGPATVGLPFGGTLLRWVVGPGETVRAGQTLALIRSPEVLAAQQEWLAAATAEEAARAERDRAERLLAEGLVSAQRLQQANRVREQAAFTARTAVDRLRRAGFDEGRLARLRSGEEEAGTYPLVAPEAGRVIRRLAAAGEFLAAHTPAVRLRPGATDWVRLRAPARLVAGLEAGQTLRVRDSGEPLVVRQRDQAVEEASQLAEVLAEFTRETKLLTGQVIAVELPLPAGGVLVPGSAVTVEGEEMAVFVRTAGGVELRRATLLPAGDDYLAAAGLRAGDEVVVRGAALLKGINAGLGRKE